MAKTLEIRYVYEDDTKGTWKYTASVKKGERISGPTSCYLLKSEYPKKPCEEVIGTFVLVGVDDA